MEKTPNLDVTIHLYVPDGQWEIVDVTFPSTPDTDYKIRHNLTPPSNEQIEYTVLRQSTPGVVYEDRSPSRVPWGEKFIVLRSDVSSWHGRLMLRVLKNPLPQLRIN